MNKKLSIVGALLMAVAVTGYSVSGTYAKYTSTYTGTSDSARVAAWNIDLKGKDEANQTFQFNLFETILDTVDNNTDADVAEKLIAPGTTGSFDIELKNLSEVNAQYTISFENTGDAGIPLEFKVGETGTWGDLTDISTPVALAMSTAEADYEKVTVYWRWAFERGEDDTTIATNDNTDTTLGKAGTAEAQVVATVTVSQVD